MQLLRPILLVSLFSPCAGAFATDLFAENVRTTPPLSPQDERRSFHLPPGFQMQLVAAEPDIAKPLNLAFDGRGRLWVSTTREYPFPARDRAPRDAIKVIELGA